jgi:TM2 domain-containing membrane protein YozV
MNFYLSKNGQQLGPYSVEQIQIFLKQGLVTTADQVWAAGWPAWMAIGSVPGLAPVQKPGSTTYVPAAAHQAPPRGPSQVSQPTDPSGLPYATDKNPVVACVLSLVIVGTGQFYNGDWVKGWIMMITCIVAAGFSLGLSWFVWAFFSAYDAYRVADRKKPLYKMFPIWS